jgi:hypothetical protein
MEAAMGLLDKVKETAGKVTEKAKEGVELGKDKVGDLKLKREIESLHEEIGALVVAKERGDAPDDADTRITAKVSEALELEARLAAGDEPAAADAEAPGGAPEAGSDDAAP